MPASIEIVISDAPESREPEPQSQSGAPRRPRASFDDGSDIAADRFPNRFPDPPKEPAPAAASRGAGDFNPARELARAAEFDEQQRQKAEDAKEAIRAREYATLVASEQRTKEAYEKAEAAAEAGRAKEYERIVQREQRAKEAFDKEEQAKETERAREYERIVAQEKRTKAAFDKAAAEEEKVREREYEAIVAREKKTKAAFDKAAQEEEAGRAFARRAFGLAAAATAGAATAAGIRGGNAAQTAGAGIGGTVGAALGARFGGAQGAAIGGQVGAAAGDRAGAIAGNPTAAPANFGSKVAKGDALGALEDQAENASMALSALVPVAGPILGTALTATAKAFTAANKVAGEFAERGRELGQYNGRIAGAAARQDVTRLMADIREAQRSGEGYAKLIEKFTGFEEFLKTFLAPLKDLALQSLPAALDFVMSALTEIVKIGYLIPGVSDSSIKKMVDNLEEMKRRAAAGAGGDFNIDVWLRPAAFGFAPAAPPPLPGALDIPLIPRP